jgi:hypothetical protein
VTVNNVIINRVIDHLLAASAAWIRLPITDARTSFLDTAARSFDRACSWNAELTTMPYQDYLATPEWQETRTAALKRAAHKCQLCGATALLNVHHNTYERRGHEIDSDLIVLCEGCHAKHHGKLGEAS